MRAHEARELALKAAREAGPGGGRSMVGAHGSRIAALQSISLTSTALYLERCLLKRRAKVTRVPGTRSGPAQSRSSDMCMNRSSPLQSSGRMKPQPFSTLYEITVPVRIFALTFRDSIYRRLNGLRGCFGAADTLSSPNLPEQRTRGHGGLLSRLGRY